MITKKNIAAQNAQAKLGSRIIGTVYMFTRVFKVFRSQEKSLLEYKRENKWNKITEARANIVTIILALLIFPGVLWEIWVKKKQIEW